MKNVLELLERTAARLPRQTAFADQQCSYDYQTVVNIAGSVGSALAANGDRNCPVAVLMERGAPCLVTLMGVLYSGNFYVVLDPEMPAERVNKILRTLQPTALICDEAHKDDPAGLDYDGKVYSAEALAAGQAQPELLQTVRRRMIDTDPAYAIFTSGSTGNPKGVVVNHRSVLAYSAWAADTFGISEKTIFGNQTPFYFSMSVTDIYATIRTGAQLHVIPKSYFSFPALLIRYLNERQVNTIYWVPSALSIVANLKVLDFMMAEHIEKVLFAGEVMPAKQLNYWRSKYPNACLPTCLARRKPRIFAPTTLWIGRSKTRRACPSALPVTIATALWLPRTGGWPESARRANCTPEVRFWLWATITTRTKRRLPLCKIRCKVTIRSGCIKPAIWCGGMNGAS